MLVTNEIRSLQLGVHQVRQLLGGGVKRNRFQLAVSSNKDGTLPALPSEERQLKLHAGYSPHSSNVKMITIQAAYRALKKLKVLSAGGEAAFQHLFRHGVKYLTPVSAQQPSSASAGARTGAAAAAAAAAAGSGTGEAPPPPASGEGDAAGSSAAAAAAAAAGHGSCSHLPCSELPTLNPNKLKKLLKQSKYGLATVAPHLMHTEPLVSQRQVSGVQCQYWLIKAEPCIDGGPPPASSLPYPIMPAEFQGVDNF